jgi:gamma-glutamylcyclotransferase (GGCT)/AIG2-like uncharacterized protein YtfP
MDENNQYLFVYGTLLDEGNTYAAYLYEHSVFYRKGKFRGTLYNIGNYPGAILQLVSGSYDYGSIFLINDPKSVLKELDDYEGFGDDFAQPNEFIRVLVTVETENGQLACWVYIYNHDTSGLPRVASGTYL